MNISDLLRNQNIRISNGYRWLIMENDKFVVYERPKKRSCGVAVYRGDDLSVALMMLQAGCFA